MSAIEISFVGGSWHGQSLWFSERSAPDTVFVHALDAAGPVRDPTAIVAAKREIERYDLRRCWRKRSWPPSDRASKFLGIADESKQRSVFLVYALRGSDDALACAEPAAPAIPAAELDDLYAEFLIKLLRHQRRFLTKASLDAPSITCPSILIQGPF